jgi:hypothetical protein
MMLLQDPDTRQKIINGQITIEHVIDLDQAMAQDIMTLERYRQIPLSERDSMQYLFSADGRQAVADGIITLERYLQIPSNERKSMQYLFSPAGQRAIWDGVITLEQYLKIPLNERQNVMVALQDPDTRRIPPDGQQALADGIITLERYLKIPLDERDSMKYLFSADGRQALAERVITLEEYLQIPSDERKSMQCLFSADGRKAVADGIMTLEQYLQIPSDERYHMKYLFSADGRQAVADGIMTLEQYLQIPWYERYTIEYLFSADGRKALADGIITLEQYLQIPRLKRDSMECFFSADGRQALADGMITLERYLQIPQHENNNMQYLFSPGGRRAMADGIITLERYLQIPQYERYNMQYLFSPGGRRAMADGIITLERYLKIPSYERQKVITALQDTNTRQSTISDLTTTTLHTVIREEVMRYLTTIAKPNTIQALRTFTDLMEQIKKEGAEVIWEHIKDNIAMRMFDEFSRFYRNRTNPYFIALVETGKYRKLGDLNVFQEQVQSGNHLSQYRSDGLEIYLQIGRQLNELENKAKDLCDRQHTPASSKASTIVNVLRGLNRDCFIEKKIDYNTYKEKSLKLIHQERPELDKHRGYQQILANLLIFIVTLGTAQLVNKAYNGNFLFFNSTDSAKKLDNLSQAIEKAVINKNQTNLNEVFQNNNFIADFSDSHRLAK